MSIVARVSVCLLVLVLCYGCAYRMGSVMHPQVSSAAVLPVENLSGEFELGRVVRDRLIEGVQRDGGVDLRTSSDADLVIQARIESAHVKAVAASLTRVQGARADDRDAYQTTVYQATVQLRFTAVVNGQDEPILDRQVVGKALFPTLPDLADARRQGLREAGADAAAQAIAALVEAW